MPFCDRNKPDWLRMIRSALKTLDYFEDHLDELVTDAAVGTRIMEGMCSVLLSIYLLYNTTLQFGVNSSIRLSIFKHN